jgi:hypothetical protein
MAYCLSAQLPILTHDSAQHCTRHGLKPIPSESLPFKVGFEVFTAETMKNDAFWDVMTCESCKNNVSEELVASIFRVEEIT